MEIFSKFPPLTRLAKDSLRPKGRLGDGVEIVGIYHCGVVLAGLALDGGQNKV